LQDVRLVDGTCQVEFYSVSDASAVLFRCQTITVDGEKLTVTSLPVEEEESPWPTADGSSFISGNNEAYAKSQQNYELEQSEIQQNRPNLIPPDEIPPIVDLKYDESSGYFYDSVTGYYYDNNTGHYYDGKTTTYYEYDYASGQFVVTDPNIMSATLVRQQERIKLKQLEEEKQKLAETQAPKKKKTVIVAAAPSTVKKTEIISSGPVSAQPKKADLVTAISHILINTKPIISTTTTTLSTTTTSTTSVTSTTTTAATIANNNTNSTFTLSATPILQPANMPPGILSTPKTSDGLFSIPVAKQKKSVTISDAPHVAHAITQSNYPTPVSPLPIGTKSNESNVEVVINPNLSVKSSSSRDTVQSLLPAVPKIPTVEDYMGRITKRNYCLLCRRKFENLIKLERHCTLSDLHRTNFKTKHNEAIRNMRSQQPKRTFPKKRKNEEKEDGSPNKYSRTETSKKPLGSSDSSAGLGLAYLLPEENSNPNDLYQNTMVQAPQDPGTSTDSYGAYRKNFQNAVRQIMRDRFNNMK